MFRADVALLGFGHVARRFASLLEERRERLSNDHRLVCRIVGIATSTHGSTFERAGIDVRRAVALREAGRKIGAAGSSLDIIERLARSDADLRVVVETTTLAIGNAQPAIGHVEASLAAGCHVVTANKGPVAFAFRRLSTLAREAGREFLFEGAVMDGVPVFNLVRETMPAVTVLGFRGIVNTTTQHILAALEAGEPFQRALARMQAAGIAEADPSLDIEGWDAAAKAAALANVLLDADLTPHSVVREGIGPATAGAARAALDRGKKLRLVVSADGRGEAARAAVKLTELDAASLLGSLPATGNALILTTDVFGETAICQMSGNLTQTAYALLSDLVTIARRQTAEPAA